MADEKEILKQQDSALHVLHETGYFESMRVECVEGLAGYVLSNEVLDMNTILAQKGKLEAVTQLKEQASQAARRIEQGD